MARFKLSGIPSGLMLALKSSSCSADAQQRGGLADIAAVRALQ
jgi:hypothetical protein